MGTEGNIIIAFSAKSYFYSVLSFPFDVF